ncbi:argininosuccinate lyase [freshwater metagenome]|uniref:Argininosuccinate lyase n=1 Tax=freshwater metagenome TaxID=449393 RepID=A0A094NYS1_9ZZZZ
MALWGGRFSAEPSSVVAALSRSVEFDWRLAPYDIKVNLAHLDGLIASGVIAAGNGEVIRAGLKALGTEILAGKFTYNDSDEDVHSAIERGLIAKIGAIGGALRAGRSRNDLVVADFKLYLVDHLLEIASLTTDLISVFNDQSEKLAKVVAPGFTHLQHAQPIVFGHELAKHSQALLRDVDRIGDWLVRNNFSPLGAGALAGSALQPNPEKSAELLGFDGVLANSIDAVSDRDFAAEALFVMAMLGVHLSRIGEEFTLWSTWEFDWVTIDDAYSTGSSIMPQKKNPDIAELARGKSGRLIGNLTGLLATLKGLPFAYNRDLQEDKEPIFDSVETLIVLLPALIGMVETAKFHEKVISSGAQAEFALATEIADYLAKKAVPFAQAHEAAGECVRLCEKSGIELHELSDEQLLKIHPELAPDLRDSLTTSGAVASRTSLLGTSTSSVLAQISDLKDATKEAKSWISNEVARFSGMMKP